MGNKLDLLVPEMRSSGNIAKVARKLGVRKLEKRKPANCTYKGETKGHNKRNALKIYNMLF